MYIPTHLNITTAKAIAVKPKIIPMDNMSIKCAIWNNPANRPAIRQALKISIIGLLLSNDFGNIESLAIASTVICMENTNPYILLKFNVIYKVDDLYNRDRCTHMYKRERMLVVHECKCTFCVSDEGRWRRKLSVFM